MLYGKILLTVLKEPLLLLLTLAVAFMVFTGAVWVPNAELILTVLNSSVSLFDKGVFLATLYESIGTNFTTVSAIYTILIAVLFGLQVTLLYYYIRRTKTSRSSLKGVGGTGVAGLLAGVFGIGCAACGTFILTSVLSLVGAGGLLAFLPFGGEEFGFLGVVLLLYSVWLLLKKLSTPAVCPV